MALKLAGSLPNEIVNYIIGHSWGVIAGGYARHLVGDARPYGDIDIFAYSAESYYKIEDYLTRLGCSASTTKHSVLFRHDISDEHYNLINFGWRKFDTIDDLINGFDFDVCQVGLDIAGLWCTPSFFANWQSEFVSFAPNYDITDPMGEMKRLIKYVKKGYKVRTSTLAKCMDVWADMSAMDRVMSFDGSQYE